MFLSLIWGSCNRVLEAGGAAECEGSVRLSNTGKNEMTASLHGISLVERLTAPAIMLCCVTGQHVTAGPGTAHRMSFSLHNSRLSVWQCILFWPVVVKQSLRWSPPSLDLRGGQGFRCLLVCLSVCICMYVLVCRSVCQLAVSVESNVTIINPHYINLEEAFVIMMFVFQ